MSGSWRAIAPSIVLFVVASAGAAAAQTVVVTKANPGSAVDLAFNGTKIGSATVGQNGTASLDVDMKAHGGQTQTNVRLSVDQCADHVRIQVVEAGVPSPAPDSDCTRADINGVYIMRRVTTFVLDLSQPTPTTWLIQGAAPATWLNPNITPGTEISRGPLPTGLMVSGGASMAFFGDIVNNACGTAAPCSGSGRRFGVDVAATYWLTEWFGVEGKYLRPQTIDVSGSGTGGTSSNLPYSFSTTLQTDFVTVAGKLGIPAGPVRIYGFGGATYHHATETTSQTTNGLAESFGVTAPAWGWMAGGGLEIWLKGTFAIFADGGYIPVKGSNSSGGQGRVDDRVIYASTGVRVHLWR